jgi:hypothetical protein
MSKQYREERSKSSINLILGDFNMESGTQSIHAYFPDQTETDSASFYEELRDYTAEGTKYSPDSYTCGCFGWVRNWICKEVSKVPIPSY